MKTKKSSMRDLALLAAGVCLASVSSAAERLAEPEGWFSIPTVGITRIDASPDGVAARYKGTIAYKNELKFESLEFDFVSQPQGSGERTVLFQFNKYRRDSSIQDHHLDGFDKQNYGYGLMFEADGTIALVSTAQRGPFANAQFRGKTKTLLTLNEKRDPAFPIHIHLTQKVEGDTLTLGVKAGDATEFSYVSTQLKGRFKASGFIGLTIDSTAGSASLENISFTGEELDTDLGETPRRVYLQDYFEEGNRRLVHWRYDEWTSDLKEVRVKSEAGDLLALVPYPKDFWQVPVDYEGASVVLSVTNVDGHESDPVSLRLQDDHADFYAAEPLERIKVKPGGERATFYEEQSGKPFFLKGFNYVRLRHSDHSNFEAESAAGPGDYDPYDAETMFKKLKENGYNTVRVFIVGRSLANPGISGSYDYDGVYAPYMDNVMDFVRRARKYGIYVFPTFCDGELPRNKRYWNIIKDAVEGLELDDVTVRSHNAIVVTREGQEARALYITDFLSYIKEKDPSLLNTLIAVQCQNEFSLNGRQWPFTLTEGAFTGPDGQSYDMSQNDQRQALYENSILSYHARMVEAVKEVVPSILVGEGVFVPRAVGKDYDGKHYGIRNMKRGDPRCPPKASTILNGVLDFVDVHVYYTNPSTTLQQSYRLDMKSTGLYSQEMQTVLKDKPYILGEFGSFKFVASTFDQARKNILKTRDLALRDQAQGYMMWTFDTFEQRCIWQAMEDESFLKELSDY